MMSLKGPLQPYTCLILLLLAHTVICGNKEGWAHHKVLDENGLYHLYWTIEDKEIQMKVEVETKGWVGLGLWSGLGEYTMEGIADDVIIGWVDGNKTFLYDFYCTNDNNLFLDKQQDWTLLSGRENKSHTILKMSRKLDTCDKMDLPIIPSTHHMIFAFYPHDPESYKSINFRQREWMTHHVKLFQPRIEMMEIPESVSYWDIRADNISISARTEFYSYCKVIRSPPLKSKHHIIKAQPIIRPSNVEVILSISVGKCTPRNRKEAEEAVARGGTDCSAPDAPSLFSRCDTLYLAWGKGGGPFLYPKHSGLPLGETTEYFLLSTYYHNPIFRKGIVDDSGFRIYHTPKLRPYDASLLGVSIATYPPTTNVIPPREKNFIASAHATPQCLSQRMPKDGINVFAVYLHAHTRARKMRIRHFRQNKELPIIGIDMLYGFHFQEFIYLPRDVKVLPGDQITVECSFDSRGELIATMFGPTLKEDMCYGFMYYYPPLPVSHIYSYTPIELVAGLTGMNLTTMSYKYGKVLEVSRQKYTDFLRDYNWPESQRCTFQNAMRYSPQEIICYSTNETEIKVPRGRYPENLKPYSIYDPCKTKERQQDEMSSTCSYHDL